MDDSRDPSLGIDPFRDDDAHAGSGGRIPNEGFGPCLKVLDLRHGSEHPTRGSMRGRSRSTLALSARAERQKRTLPGRLFSVIDDELSRAVVSFLGSPGVLDPMEPERRVAVLLGDRAWDVVPRIRALLADLDAASPPFWHTAELQDMGDRIERWLRETHPELDGYAVKAVANSYTFDYK